MVGDGGDLYDGHRALLASLLAVDGHGGRIASELHIDVSGPRGAEGSTYQPPSLEFSTPISTGPLSPSQRAGSNRPTHFKVRFVTLLS